MKKAGETLGVLLVLNGIAGLVHEWLGWFRLWAIVRRFDLLDRYEIPANIALLVLGLAVLVAADHLPETEEKA
jgi:hypothetical protein